METLRKLLKSSFSNLSQNNSSSTSNDNFILLVDLLEGACVGLKD